MKFSYSRKIARCNVFWFLVGSTFLGAGSLVRARPPPKAGAGAGADPRRRGAREAPADGCALPAELGPPARPLGAKRFRSGAGYAHLGTPIRLLGAKRSRGAHVAPSLLTFAAASVWCSSVPERSDKLSEKHSFGIEANPVSYMPNARGFSDDLHGITSGSCVAQMRTLSFTHPT